LEILAVHVFGSFITHLFVHKKQQQPLTKLCILQEKEMLDFQRKIESSFTVISDQFVDPPKAKEDLWELHKMGDDTVFKELSILLDPSTSIAHARAASVRFSLSYNSALRGSCSSTKSSPPCHSPIFTQFNTKTHSGKWL
jgi:hypothetical protein